MIRKYSFVLLILISCKKEKYYNFADNKNLDKIISNASTTSSIDSAVKLLEKAHQLNNDLPDDTIKSSFYRKIACQYYNVGLLEEYHNQTIDNITFSSKINDTVILGKLYYDLGDYFYEKNINDSSFYYYNKAIKAINNATNEKIRTQFNIAKLLLNENQLIECEVQLFKTITAAEQQKDVRLLYECYSILGVVQNGLKNYNEALKSFEISKNYLDKISNDKQFTTLLCENYNNTANVYLNSKDYPKAIELYQKGLDKRNIRNQSPKVYAMLVDNLAYAKLLNNTLKNPNSFYEAMQIRDSLDYKLGILMSQQRLGEYYLMEKDSTNAFRYFSLAYALARQTRSFRDQLVLLKLKKLVNPTKAVEYQEKYINLSDSMLLEERITRNKFTKIEFETEQIEQEKIILTKKINFILILASLCLLILGFIYTLYRQKVKYKVLFLEKEQQKSNEEVYNLLLIQQQQLDQGKAFEKKRISTELHDGVISKLFGIRMHLERLIFLDKILDLKQVENYFGKLNELENDIRIISHKLSDDLALKNHSFILVIQNYLYDFQEDNGLKTQLYSDDSINWELLTNEQKMNLFRILQESLTNIRKYAQAKMIILNFRTQDNVFSFSIFDDGIGFNPSKISSGIGIKNMYFRMENLNGSLIINSNKNGTEIKGHFPLVLVEN